MYVLQPGVYTIRCKVNDKRYVGSSSDVPNRFCLHRVNLKCGIHHNRHLQSDYSAYGADAFEYDHVFRIDSRPDYIRREYALTRHYAARGKAYNIHVYEAKSAEPIGSMSPAELDEHVRRWGRPDYLAWALNHSTATVYNWLAGKGRITACDAEKIRMLDPTAERQKQQEWSDRIIANHFDSALFFSSLKPPKRKEKP